MGELRENVAMKVSKLSVRRIKGIKNRLKELLNWNQ